MAATHWPQCGKAECQRQLVLLFFSRNLCLSFLLIKLYILNISGFLEKNIFMLD